MNVDDSQINLDPYKFDKIEVIGLTEPLSFKSYILTEKNVDEVARGCEARRSFSVIETRK